MEQRRSGLPSFVNLQCLSFFAPDTPYDCILWVYPWSERDFHWLTVPATRSWWVWSFVFDWSFLFEVAICVAAAVLFVVRRNVLITKSNRKRPE